MPFSTVPLNDGNKISEIVFGTGSVWKGKEMEKYIVQALKAGFYSIDTAQAYGTEPSVGAALRAADIPREDVFITTKWISNPYDHDSDVRGELVKSLKKMDLKYVDLYLIHSPQNVNSLSDVWKKMEAVVGEGLAKSIGVSNFEVHHLEKIRSHATITPAVNQIGFNPYRLGAMGPVVDYCKNNSIVVEAYSPLAPITRQPGGPVDAPVYAAAARLKATPGQVLLAWLHAKGIVIVTTSSKEERLKEYLGAGDLVLTEDEIAAIDEAGLRGARTQGASQASRRLVLKQTIWKHLAILCLAAAIVVSLHWVIESS